jgi:hypothetical protein
MAAPDFYFVINALFRHLHDTFGREQLERYWRQLGVDYYGDRVKAWREGGATALAADWRDYFAKEPGAQVQVIHDDQQVELRVNVCPAIKHLRENKRDIVPYFCDHCDHVVGAMAGEAGYAFSRAGGMGSCTQVFVPLGFKNR